MGDVADEVFGSYRGFTRARTPQEFQTANVDMLLDIHYFDVLRSDRTISAAGLEARVPFADQDFLNYCMDLDPKMKMFRGSTMEKHILRIAFTGYLPDEVLWRRKEAFSDGVSSNERSWYQVIREHVSRKYEDIEQESCDMDKVKFRFPNLPPPDAETMWYRTIFERWFGKKFHPIPNYWKHPFAEKEEDPSARSLQCY